MLTFAATAYVANAARNRARLRFALEVRQTQETLYTRFDTYTSLLRGLSGLFAASSGGVTRAEFQNYVRHLNLVSHYPGVRGLGYSCLVAPAEEAALVASLRAQGETGFHLWPPRTQEQGLKPRQAIIYAESVDNQKRTALGFDMTTIPERREAMERARDTGMPAATGRLLLLNTDDAGVQHPGFLLYLPVYHNDRPLSTPEQRRRALQGYVYCGFRSAEFFDNAISDRPGIARHLSVEAYDADGIAKENLLFRSEARPAPAHLWRRGGLTAQEKLPVAGREWTVRYSPADGFYEGDTELAPWVLLAGLIISGLFFGITLALARSRDRSAAAAERLRVSEDALRENDVRQRAFFRDVLLSVTEGRLRLCDTPADLPPRLPSIIGETELTEPTLRLLRRDVREAAGTIDMPPDRAHDLLTAVGEASMNAVVHAGGGIAYVATGQSPRGDQMVQVWVEDRGKGIDMGSLPRATLERGYSSAGTLGHGFYLILQSVDRLWLLTGSDGTIIVLEQEPTAQDSDWLESAAAPTQESS